jgi:hypothetical protein
LPEPGTGLEPLANSYVTLAEFVDYWTDRGFDFTTYTTPAVQRSLIQATDYIELVYGQKFKGYKLEEDQPLQFPREGVYIGCEELDAMPLQLKRATYEYAKRVLTSSTGLMPDPANTDDTGAILKYKFKKIGPIETKTEYLAGSGGNSVQSYPAADMWLQDLIYSRQSRTIRA